MAVLQPNAGHGSKLKTTLHRSQQAPAILGQEGSGGVLSRWYTSLDHDGSNDFDSLEKLFFSCLQSADDKSALLCLERLTHRFGPSNERIMALRSIYDEAIAEDKPSLEGCLKKSDNILSQNPVNLVCGYCPNSKPTVLILPGSQFLNAGLACLGPYPGLQRPFPA